MQKSQVEISETSKFSDNAIVVTQKSQAEFLHRIASIWLVNDNIPSGGDKMRIDLRDLIGWHPGTDGLIGPSQPEIFALLKTEISDLIFFENLTIYIL